mmetsp:Transcript_42763/g.35921  ORF Transcript_42763/g.35921 Transcript_42763/m.35921 type:complete len:106 (-) Transcript_42763:559-876(-)
MRVVSGDLDVAVRLKHSGVFLPARDVGYARGWVHLVHLVHLRSARLVPELVARLMKRINFTSMIESVYVALSAKVVSYCHHKTVFVQDNCVRCATGDSDGFQVVP